MHGAALPPLSEWESFYVIVGSSGAALTGLMFVVIALGADARVLVGEEALGAFATPNIVHFCAVLLISAFLSMPGHTTSSLSACLLVGGVAGLAYATSIVVKARRQKGYTPVLEDWIWHTILPTLSYAALILAGVLVRRAPAPALYLVAAIALLLLFVGIHNAWDSAVWMANKQRKPETM
jgi:hypothetical protein